jgi:hypothetical protein
MTAYAKIAFAIAAMLDVALARAAEERVVCPTQIPESSIKLSNCPTSGPLMSRRRYIYRRQAPLQGRLRSWQR